MLLGSFRALSPLNTDSHVATQYGDHSRQFETSQLAHVSSHLLHSFGDRGDHIFEEAVCEFQSSKPDSSVSSVDHASEAGVLPAGNSSAYPDVELTDKSVQPEIKDSSIDPVATDCSKYESGDTGQTLSDVMHVGLSVQNTVPNSVSSTDKRLNWETLFMPYRRQVDAAEIVPSVPVAVAKETRCRIPTNLATIHEDFSDSSITRHYSEGDIVRPDHADTLVDNTSLWVILCNVSVTDVKFIWLEFLCLVFVVYIGDVFAFKLYIISKL